MKFEEALVELRKGKELERGQWEGEMIGHKLKLIKDKFVIIHKDFEGFSSTMTFTIEDFESNDWEIYEEPGKTFPEVFEAFKEGKKIRRKSWSNKQAYVTDFTCHECGNLDIDKEDILANDWEILE